MKPPAHRPIPVVCLFLVCVFLPAAAQPTTHFVDVGLNFSEFIDRDTGVVSSFGLPVPTFVAVGDTVVWVFHAGFHSTTSGSCANFTCTPDGLWNLQAQNPGVVFSRTFDTPGTFPYFCQFNQFFGQGQVVVLTQPDFEMRVSNQFGQTLTSMTGWVGNSMPFTGQLFSRLGFNSPVTLSCANGSPRLPSRCPSGPVTVTPSASGTPFIFSVSDDFAGAYDFQIVARAADAAQTTHSQTVQLNLLNFTVSPPSPDSVLVFANGVSLPMHFRVSAENPGHFNIFVNLECEGFPPGVNCFFLQDGFFTTSISVPPGLSEDVALTLTASPSAVPGFHNGRIEATSSLFFNIPTTAVRIRPVSVQVIGLVTHFDFEVPATTLPGAAFPMTVTARDASDGPVINYSGTIRFTSSDPAATLPADYTFVSSPVSENGVHTFPAITFNRVGPRTLTITDLGRGISTTKQTFVGNLNPNNSVALSVSSRPAFFRNEAVTFNVVVSGAGPSPTGAVRFFEGINEIGMALLTPTVAGSASGSFTHRLTLGDHTVVAVYEGDTNYGANFSGEITKHRSPTPRCVGDRCPGSH